MTEKIIPREAATAFGAGLKERPSQLNREVLDLDTGLYYTAHNRALYDSLLNAFVANNSTVLADVQAALASGDVETARRILHSLKGVAATIGAKELHKAAKAAERSVLDDEQGVVWENVLLVDAAMEALMHQIDFALHPERV